MKWSKIKREVEDLLADSLKGKVVYHSTRYGRGRGSSQARGWVTFDGKEIFCSSQKGLATEGPNRRVGVGSLKGVRYVGWHAFDTEQTEQLWKEGHFTTFFYVYSLNEYINLKINDALKSKSPLVRAFTMFDRRLGKRRLMKIQMTADEYQVVKDFHHIRCQVEEIHKLMVI